MSSHLCFIVPPYLLQGIANNAASAPHREAAQRSLAHRDTVTAKREQRLRMLTAPRGSSRFQPPAQTQAIVPDFLLRHIAESGDEVDVETRERARRDLEHIQQVHRSYQAVQAGQGPSAGAVAGADAAQQQGAILKHGAGTGTTPAKAKFYRAVYDAKQTEDEDALPGTVLRVEGQKAVTDGPANEAFDNVGAVLDFYAVVFGWVSIDNQNMHVLSSVHFGKEYENAFWDPEKMQMVFGDGHDFLYHFTKCIDVIGHEMTHAVTEHTSPLDYEGQSGALNEHISDVFGIMIKQKVDNETADKADWLIGEGCLLPGVKGVALRSMKAPGTAYNDPRFGSDPQPDHMSGYKPMADDNGGVHVYSGIPNRAFYLAAVGFGGYSWEKAGKVWWRAMNSGRVPPKCTFLQFADVTVEVALELFGDDGAKVVRTAWDTVGVVRAGP